LIEKIQEWTGKAHRRAAQIEGSPGPLATRVPQPLLSKLAEVRQKVD
jgi:hypothetical protein